jgi:uncharacterized repeat protein (TIGR01451 family)
MTIKFILIFMLMLVSVGVVSADTYISIGDGWHSFSFQPCETISGQNPFTYGAFGGPPPHPMLPPTHIRITSGGMVAGFRFRVYDEATLLGSTSWVPDAVFPPFSTTNPDTAYAGNHYSRGCFNVPAAQSHYIYIVPFHDPWHPFCQNWYSGGWLSVEEGACPPWAPDLQLTKTVDQADANPGDTLTYTVTVRNIGTAKAVNVQVVDTLPGGGTETRALPDMDGGQSRVETFSYTVPVNTADGAVLTNLATVTGMSETLNPDTDPANNSDDVSTTIHSTGNPINEFPLIFMPATLIIGFTGAVVLIQRTREN